MKARTPKKSCNLLRLAAGLRRCCCSRSRQPVAASRWRLHRTGDRDCGSRKRHAHTPGRGMPSEPPEKSAAEPEGG